MFICLEKYFIYYKMIWNKPEIYISVQTGMLVHIPSYPVGKEVLCFFVKYENTLLSGILHFCLDQADAKFWSFKMQNNQI